MSKNGNQKNEMRDRENVGVISSTNEVQESDNVKWFEPDMRGGRDKRDVFAMTLTTNPKGVRFNVVVSRFFAERDVHFIKIGVINRNVNKYLAISEAEDTEIAFKLLGNEAALHVSAAATHNWIVKNIGEEILGERIVGEWSEEFEMLIFPLKKYVEEQSETIGNGFH